MAKVAIMCLRVVIAAMAFFVAMIDAMAVFMIALFHVILAPFISMARDFSSAFRGTPPLQPHRSFLLLRLGIVLAVAIGMFVSVVAPPHKRLLHAVAIGILVVVFCRPWQELAPWVAHYYLLLALLWFGFYSICLTRAEVPQLNRPT
jgi:tellurite resistance protein TehA-like permease